MHHTVERVGLGYLVAAVTALTAAAACGSNRTSATAPSPPSAGGPVAPPAVRGIVVLGDSLAVSPSMSESFPAVLQKRLDAERPGWTISNAGIAGDTTVLAMRRFDEAVNGDAKILILELGANDSFQGRAISAIEDNLSWMIERAQARGIQVLLCGMETPPLKSLDYSLEFHRLFPRLADRYRIPLVPFLLTGVVLNPDYNLSDGIHPNAAGAQRIADTVWTYLRPMVSTTRTTGTMGTTGTTNLSEAASTSLKKMASDSSFRVPVVPA